MLWLRFLNVPAGTYTVDVSPTIQASTATSCPTSAPFRYQSPHNAVKLWVLDARNYDCHPLTLNELDTFPQTNADALPATFPITTSKHCLLAQVHLDLCASGSHTYTVTASLKQGGTVIQSCTHQITIA